MDYDKLKSELFGPEVMGEYGSRVRLIDQFAMAVLPGVMATESEPRFAAVKAYKLAQAMISERNLLHEEYHAIAAANREKEPPPY